MDFRIYEIKLFSLLVAELRRAGLNPYVLLSNRRKQYWARRYFKTYGINNFIYWDEIGLNHSPNHLVDEFDDDISFNSVKEWKHQGCWIGPQVLASISRSNHIGAPDVKSHEIRQQLKDRLQDTLQRIPVAKKIVLKEIRPVKILLSEANYAKYAPLTDLAVNAKIDVMQIIQTSRDDALTMRRPEINQQEGNIHQLLIKKTLEKLVRKT